MTELLALGALLALAWAVTQPRLGAEPFCAWCLWRAGETCTHPASPVGDRSCGPVCGGEVRCPPEVGIGGGEKGYGR
jgi:hypothetical protein